MAKFDIALQIAAAIEAAVSEILRMGIRLRSFGLSDKEIAEVAVELVREAYALKENRDGTVKSNIALGRNLTKFQMLAEKVNALKGQVTDTLKEAQTAKDRTAYQKQTALNEKAVAATRERMALELAERGAIKVKEAGAKVVETVNQRLKQTLSPVVRKPGEIREAKGQVDLGLIDYTADFDHLTGKTVARPVVIRPKTGYHNAGPEDVDFEDDKDEDMEESKKEIYLETSRDIVDYCPPAVIIEFASLHGNKMGDTVFVDHLVLEIGGPIDDNPWAKRVIDKGMVDRRTGIRWRVVADSGSGMRQGKLFLWPEQYAAESLNILAGDYLAEWLKQKMVPSKMVAYLGLGFSSLIFRIHGEHWAKGAKVRVVSDAQVKHAAIKAVRHGREHTTIEHTETVTDGVIAVGSAVMRRLEKAIGFPERTIHAVQIRGDLGSAIKGLMVEYPEIDPELIMVFESATKMTKDVNLVTQMLQNKYLGITRINRLPDNLPGVTSLSKQVLGLLPKDSMNAVQKARDVAKWTANNVTTPAAAKMLLGLLDSEDEEMLLQAATDAARDGDMKKAALLRNPALALQDRTIRRYVADMLVDKIRRQATFGNLLVNGFDLWQAPEPLIIKAVEQDLITDVVTVTKLKTIAKKLGMRLLAADEVAWAGCPRALKGNPVALIRHPLQHPAQFAIGNLVKLVKDHRWGIVFMPAAGIYQATMGGSDFDGDEIKLVVDMDLIDAIDIAREGMDYIIMPPAVPGDKVQITSANYQELLRLVLHRAMKAVGQIGILSNLASTVSALTANDKQREMLLSVLAFLVMVAVDAVKTGDFPDAYIRKLLTPDDLVGSPLKLDGNALKVVRTKYGGRDMARKAVWLGQAPEFREYLAKLDRTVMAGVFMDMDKLSEIVRGGQRDSNDKRVAAQLMRAARAIMTTPEDLKPIAEQIIDLLPIDLREESLARLEVLRKEKSNALWNQQRVDVQDFNRKIKSEKEALSSIMAIPTEQAREFLRMVGSERARALTAVIYSIRPAAAWAFCGPELVDLFGRADNAPSLLVKALPSAGQVKLMGIEYNGITVPEALALVYKTGSVTVTPVKDEAKGMWIHRVFIGEQCIGQVSTEFEPYAETISGQTMKVNIRRCSIEGRTLIVRFDPPNIENGHALWLDRTLSRISDMWSSSVLDSLAIALRSEWRAMEGLPAEYALQIKQALEDQEEGIDWANEIDDAKSMEELTAITQRLRQQAVHLSDRVKKEINSLYKDARRRVSGEIDMPM